MDGMIPPAGETLSEGRPVNLSRRGLLGGLVLGVALPGLAVRGRAAAAQAAARPVSAFLEIRPDGAVILQSPFNEGGQGVFTAMAQIVGEELDSDPARFIVQNAPANPVYQVMSNGMRITGGSMSVRMSYAAMRGIGAAARAMLLQAAATRLGVPVGDLTTENGQVRHAASGRSLAYGALAAEAAALPVPVDVPLKSPGEFRWIGKPLARLDVHEKSTGRAVYSIDITVEGMLQAAVRHARRLGQEPGAIANEVAVRAMPGVHSIHRLPGAVAVVADRWWRARRAVEALQVAWQEPAVASPRAMPADFSSEGLRATLAALPGPGITAEEKGDVAAALRGASRMVEATYDAPFLAHGQLEPPSATARWNPDGTLDLWLPNQAPEMFQRVAATAAGIAPEQVRIHSPLLGGFFGRHFLYEMANPFPQAIQLAKAVGRPVKVIWSREEEFLRDAVRPMGVVRFRAGLDASGMPVAIEALARGEGPLGRVFGRRPDAADPSVVEGMSGKPYAIAHRRVADVRHEYPVVIGFWRSVGHSMNDFFYESFLDEIADAGGKDPFALRRALLADSPRHRNLLDAVADLSGGWKRGPFTAPDGSRRARGVAMASPFGSEVATIAEVSLADGQVRVHDVWVAIDPGSIVNPAIIEAQVQSAVAIGLSSALLEEVVYEHGMPRARNYDGYPILPPGRMPRVHTRIIESGAAMGGIGEPGVPGVPPAVANAVAVLTGRRLRSLPLSKARFGDQA
ncbi:Isoquinoline 1-oxidoreductase beta subunit [Rhodovastum atsumiense]|uniref:Xanthine dehydrogenase family protein molybdopterin-binding subunit n=1 Tax=Rhodovastum atsumiense TaxID=504468 RepID=A0A5M6ISJ1_9PROT|nr:xanthine dehydrogenase family protein molybdopterin-binding subunit [Rhodovastum atsumiense]KAA5611161.1 xanthine dehydrogenase family protein molybdopterin-binding subunit [Rhodovastum atsumiense]CAH2602534.1 Isoquinoline 1-oxidoreductase beta subunit [Rhodovastum atsumiense]